MSKPIKTSPYFSGLYGSTPEYFEPSIDDIKCELQLSAAFNSWAKLNWKPNTSEFMNEIQSFDELWTPYLQREGRPNNRYGILLTGLPGDKSNSPCSLPEIRKLHKDDSIHDIDMSTFTDAYDKLPSLHPILDFFAPLGRTYILKMGPGSYFPPHRDDPLLTRKTFRIAGFIGNVEEESFIWQMEDGRKHINNGDFAYVDTRKIHGTATWNGGDKWGYHIIMDIPKTWENVLKVISIAQSI